MATLQKITPFLWFDRNAEDAVAFYCSTFGTSRVITRTHYSDAGPGPKGSVMTLEFELEGQRFIALNGGPEKKFTEAVSFVVHCHDQPEVDRLWERLSDGGRPGPCGWLHDRFGLSWQIVPSALLNMLRDQDVERSTRVMRAVFEMGKLDIRALERAYEGRGS